MVIVESGGDVVDVGVCVCECVFFVLVIVGWYFGVSGYGDVENVVFFMSIVFELNVLVLLKCWKFGVFWIRMWLFLCMNWMF